MLASFPGSLGWAEANAAVPAEERRFVPNARSHGRAGGFD
jgi:hypothetical protein